ncbi:MAG TPA: hypothetical protein HA263_07850 [Methanoregulaceae archaeon]|nr:hypothetical protein [Methanoregulaceae archaeon]
MKLTDEFDRDILHYAFRYALGRRSYAVGIVIGELRRNWSDLRQFDRELVKKEIRAALADWERQNDNFGCPFMPDDLVRDWSAILEWSP